MTVQIKLTDQQCERLKKIQQAYASHGLDFTLQETFEIIFRAHAKDYLDQQLERVEGTLFTAVKGRIKGCTWRDTEQ